MIGHLLPAAGRCTLRILLSVVTCCAPLQAVSAADRIVGHASVVDGDVLAIAGYRIRLHGIDAPEGAQVCTRAGRPWLCGQRAALALDDRIAGTEVACDLKSRDRYGDLVAVCRLRGEDLAAWMVAQGWALASRHRGSDYAGLERTAERHRRGMWEGNFMPAWTWRQQEERAFTPVSAARPPPPKKIGPPVRLTPPAAKSK